MRVVAEVGRRTQPCTTVARTHLDLADVVPRRSVERTYDQAEVLGVFDLSALEDQIARNPTQARERDPRRDQRAVLAGWQPVRTTGRQVKRRPRELEPVLLALVGAPSRAGPG
jgi:hypothetical protein